MTAFRTMICLGLMLASVPVAAAAAEPAAAAPAAAAAAAPAAAEASAHAATGPADAEASAAKPGRDAVTQHQLAIDGKQIAYKATAGSLPVPNAKGEPAHMFYTAYAVDAGAKPRPITFVFNGGPGAASAFLHIGAIGPRVVPFNDVGSAALTPVRLADNPDTWLDVTDLVFVDPISTGFSRAASPDDAAKFFDTDKDADAMQDFVRLYLARTGRSLDPVFLAGESYGGFRAALLSRRLLLSGFDLRGAVLISPALEFSLIRGDSLGLLPDMLALPSMALSHAEQTGGLKDASALRAEVEAFARGPYLAHLAAGARDDPKIDVALAGFTGMSLSTVAHLHGDISVSDFTDDFRRSTDRALSLYDGSVSAALPTPSSYDHDDPILDHAIGVLAPAFTAYSSGELGYVTDLPYLLLNRSVSGNWQYGGGGHSQGFAGATDDLEKARTQRPSLRVMIAQGYTDLVTPYADSQFLIDQMRPIEGAVPIELKVYPGGHMMYLRASSRKALAADVRALYKAAMPATPN